MSRQQTNKTVKVVGTRQYIDAETGELQTMAVTTVEDRDFNFHKFWMKNFIQTLDIVGNKKTKLCFWVIDNLDRENKLCKTYRQIAVESGISLDTVRITMQLLLESNFIRRINQGCYIVNPDVSFKGTRKGRMNVLNIYAAADAPVEPPTPQERVDSLTETINMLTKQLEDAKKALATNNNQSNNVDND